MNTPVAIVSRGKAITVTLIDANHCPGAVMFLFHVGKRCILHVGDFRWDADTMLRNPTIRGLAAQKPRLDDLFLDTTYCNEKYCLPSQQDAIAAAVEVATEEFEESKRRKERLLMLFGAYTIGKERIYLSVAEKLGRKVYVDRNRYRTLSLLDWSKERLSILTTDPSETCLWVVPLGHINFKRMVEYVNAPASKALSSRSHDRVVGFRPTGWSMTATARKANATNGRRIVTSRTSGALTVHGVPYSEHSSYTELVDCLDCLRPLRIIPTVTVSKSDAQVERLLQSLRRKDTERDERIIEVAAAACIDGSQKERDEQSVDEEIADEGIITID